MTPDAGSGEEPAETEFRDTIPRARGLPFRLQHGISDDDIGHAIDYALAIGETGDAGALYLGPGRAGNLLEIVAILRDDGTEIVIHAMRMRAKYEPFLRGEKDDRG